MNMYDEPVSNEQTNLNMLEIAKALNEMGNVGAARRVLEILNEYNEATKGKL